VGAGTGIWSQMLFDAGLQVDAVEPNAAMREAGAAQRPNLNWVEGSAEDTGLPGGRYDFVSMASSFHWPDFNKAASEFGRLLKSGGYFAALWNTREISGNSLLEDIEAKLYELIPGLTRISSGRSEFTESLYNRLRECGIFGDVIYIEGRHVERQTREHYIGLWESVNDIRVQAGEDKFNEFIKYLTENTRNFEQIYATYLTRAWLARSVD
jgi:SAM-dependent methyltransferase